MSEKQKNKKKKTLEAWVYISKGKTKHIRASSQKELDRMRREIEAQRDAGKDVYSTAYFGDWADKWYAETKANSRISESALTVIQSTLKHLKNYFDRVQLKDLKLSDFQMMINELAANNPNTNKPASADLLKKITSNAASICKYAAANNIAYVPTFFDYVTIPKQATQKKRRALSEEEQNYIIEFDHRMQLPAMIMLFSGLRRGECLALSWSDINLTDGRIHVNKSIEFGKNQGKIKEGGKTDSATRMIPIPQILIDYLKEYKSKQKILSSSLVCLTPGGAQYTKSSWVKGWTSYMLDLNLKYGLKDKYDKNDPKIKASELPQLIQKFDPHDLRHTYATMLFLQDISEVNAMQLLGHNDIRTTVNIYADFKSLNKDNVSEEYMHHLRTDYKVKIA